MKGKPEAPPIEKEATPDKGKAGADSMPAEKDGDHSSDAPSNEEMAAFDKIMGEIEDQETKKISGSSNDPESEERGAQALPEGEPSTAEDRLEASDHETGMAGDDGLDADQQKAFESIMSQIEGGGSGEDEDAGPEATPGDPSAAEARDDFSAELEKVVLEADSQEGRTPIDEKNEKHLDAGLLDVVGDSKEPTEAGDKTKAAEDLRSESMGPDPTDPPEGQDVDSAGLADDKPDDEPHDISDDIDDILKEISSSEDEAHLPETDDEQIVIQEAVSNVATEDTVPDISSPAGKKEKLDLSEENPPAGTPSAHQADETRASTPGLKAPQVVAPLKEAPVSTGGGKKKIGLAVAVAIFLLALAGYLYWGPKDRTDPLEPVPVQDARDGETVVEPDPVVESVEPVIADFGTSDESRLKTAADSLDRLRNELIAKQEEIEELRAYYQAGIDAEIQGVVDLVRDSGGGKVSFQSALADPRISLGLAAIQRRESYIKKLAVPVKRLFRGSEELLFLSRMAELLALMAGKTSDIDIDGFIQQANEASQAHRSAMDQLNIDAVTVPPLALEDIWKDIGRQLSTTAVKPGENQPAIKADNETIWKDICDADYSEKHKLTALSPDAARCLARWKGKDLFLNAVTELSPEAARHLADWDGDWLGLNGLQELSPETAVHLARWKGKGLSLNGLSRLSPRVVAILSEWQGDQIELVNVKHMAYWENPKIRLFLSEDLKRKRNAARN